MDPKWSKPPKIEVIIIASIIVEKMIFGFILRTAVMYVPVIPPIPIPVNPDIIPASNPIKITALPRFLPGFG